MSLMVDSKVEKLIDQDEYLYFYFVETYKDPFLTELFHLYMEDLEYNVFDTTLFFYDPKEIFDQSGIDITMASEFFIEVLYGVKFDLNHPEFGETGEAFIFENSYEQEKYSIIEVADRVSMYLTVAWKMIGYQLVDNQKMYNGLHEGVW